MNIPLVMSPPRPLAQGKQLTNMLSVELMCSQQPYRCLEFLRQKVMEEI